MSQHAVALCWTCCEMALSLAHLLKLAADDAGAPRAADDTGAPQAADDTGAPQAAAPTWRRLTAWPARPSGRPPQTRHKPANKQA